MGLDEAPRPHTLKSTSKTLFAPLPSNPKPSGLYVIHPSTHRPQTYVSQKQPALQNDGNEPENEHENEVEVEVTHEHESGNESESRPLDAGKKRGGYQVL
ncbi:hypothetical protein HMI56_006313 [Coelomomyces lativittatus]|nr:hypothetical protein HMI56_006313 [Coelomomyces lativittatus]